MSNNMKKLMILISILIFVTNAIIIVDAIKCENNSGIVKSRIRIKDENGTWDKWKSSYDVESYKDEIFEFKTNVTYKQNCSMYIILNKEEDLRYDNDNYTDIFKIIDGPTEDFGKKYTDEDCVKSESKEYIWTIKQTYNKSIEGIFDFESKVGFTKNGGTHFCYDNSYIVIKNETQEAENPNENVEKDDELKEEDNSNTPGFELLLILISISVIAIIKKRK